MLNLRSFYRQYSGDCETQRQEKEEGLRVGICDYIPQQYFSKQYFSIYIEEIPVPQIVKSILWNQFYQKTLLKQIYAQLTTLTTKSQNSLISKLDNMFYKGTNNTDLIYLKIGSHVYNLKDKLQYPSVLQIQKQIKQTKSLTIQKITHQGKWKKIFISFAPYQNKSQIDIIFTFNQPKSTYHQNQHQSKTHEYSDSINQIISNPKNTTQIKPKKHPIRKNSTQSQKKSYQNSQSPNSKSKNVPISTISSKQKSKSKLKNSVISSHQKSPTAFENFANSQNKIETNRHDFNQNQIISNSFEKSIKKQNKVLQCNSSEREILKEIDFNNTSKLSSSDNFGKKIEQEQTQTFSMDLRRKQTLKLRQNSIKNDKMFTTDSETIKSYNDRAKSSSVLAQILSKKEETIQSQKRRMQQMQLKHIKQIQELKLKHLKGSQSYKNEISHILGEYNKKYESEKEDSKRLRAELKSLEEVLSENKVMIAELQITSKFNEQENSRSREENSFLRNKVSQIESKHNQLILKSQQQKSQISNQKDKAQSLADKYLLKYNNLAKKLRLLAQQEQNNS